MTAPARLGPKPPPPTEAQIIAQHEKQLRGLLTMLGHAQERLQEPWITDAERIEYRRQEYFYEREVQVARVHLSELRGDDLSLDLETVARQLEEPEQVALSVARARMRQRRTERKGH